MQNWFSIKKPLIKRYCKVNLYVVPKFLVQTVTSFQICMNILIKCFVRRNKIRLFFLYKAETTFTSNQDISKNLKWTFTVLKMTPSYHTVQVATLQNIYFGNKVDTTYVIAPHIILSSINHEKRLLNTKFI